MAKEKLRLMYERETRKVVHPLGKGKAPVDTTFNEDSKIQSMLDKFARGEIHPRQPFYADVTEFSDFRVVQERVIKLTNEFMKLPAEVRALAKNDPANIGSVFSDPRNKEMLRNYGVFKQVTKDDAAPGSEGEPSLSIAATALKKPKKAPEAPATPDPKDPMS